MDLSMKILVVDDFPSIRRLMLTVLKKIGFTDIVLVEDGETALKELKKQKFDLILADWNMPGMDGLELLKYVRSDKNYKEVPFVMVTAETKAENVIKAVEAGATSYIVKPFTLEAMREKLDKIFGG